MNFADAVAVELAALDARTRKLAALTQRIAATSGATRTELKSRLDRMVEQAANDEGDSR